MNVRTISLAVLACLSLLLASCGGSPSPAPQTPDYSAIQGNWRIVGQHSFPSFPTSTTYIGLTLVVSGSTINARGQITVPCSQSSSAVGFPFLAIGQIASDGTFLLALPSPSPINGIQVTIQGAIPAVGASTWKGTYSVSGTASTFNVNPCTIDQNNNFTATAYPQFRGTYSGTLINIGPGTGISVVLQVSQGAPTFAHRGPQGAVNEVYIPLSGNITVTAPICSVSAPLNPGSFLVADTALMQFSASDGSTLILGSSFSDPTETTLYPVSLFVTSGQCGGIEGIGTLTLQP